MEKEMAKLKTMILKQGCYLIGFLVVFLSTSLALAQELMPDGGGADWKGAAMAIALGLAAIGGALGQGKAISAALEGIARNPSAQDKIFTPMILGLAFIESLVIFTLVYKFF